MNVIGGWFFTAFIAFTAAGVIAFLIHLGGPTAIAILIFAALLILGRNYVSHRKELEEEKKQPQTPKDESVPDECKKRCKELQEEYDSVLEDMKRLERMQPMGRKECKNLKQKTSEQVADDDILLKTLENVVSAKKSYMHHRDRCPW